VESLYKESLEVEYIIKFVGRGRDTYGGRDAGVGAEQETVDDSDAVKTNTSSSSKSTPACHGRARRLR